MENLTTEKGALILAQDVMKQVKENLEASGTLMPVSFVLATKTDKGVELPDPALIVVGGVFDDAGSSKDYYALALKDIIKKTGAIGVMFVAESWTLETNGMTPAQMEAEGRKWAGRIHLHPRRKEIVFVSFEHISFKNGSKSWVASIERGADGTPILGAFEALPDNASMKGRFCDLLRREGVN